MFIFFAWIWRLILCRQKSQKTVPSSSEPYKPTKFVNFIKHLILVQRTIKQMRNRTKYRSLKNIRENALEVLDDKVYYRKNTQKFKFSFIRNKTFRYATTQFKKFYTRKCKFLNDFLSRKNIKNIF